MIRKSFFLLLSLTLSSLSLFSSVYYVATNGNNASTGSILLPFATIQRAQQSVIAGDTVYVRGGTYVMTESQIALQQSIWSYVTYLDKSGTSGKRINYWAYPGERPVFDLTNVKPAGYRVTVFQVMGSWIYLKGLEVIGVQVTILTHTQSECFENQGSNNIYEQLKMHDGQAIGFYLTKGSNNLVLNCDAYQNWDYTSEGGVGGNVDGFGCHPSKGSTGNVIRGCRSWFNSDDGYDCINANESVTFENCWSFYNGYSTSFASKGDGNGFKAGGYGQSPVVADLPNPIPAHTVRFCMAYRNKANGFYSNHHVTTGSIWYNNTAYRNAVNFNMLSQRVTISSKTGADTTLDGPGFNHVLHNNVSYKYSSLKDTLNIGKTCDITSNSFTPLTTVVVDATDFVSVDESLLIAPRQVDGSLPETGFLHLKSTSDLIDKGVDLGFAYNGATPDLGAFEFKSSQSINLTSIGSKTVSDVPFQPNATATSGLQVAFTSSNPAVAVIVNNNITMVGVGTTVITASQGGNASYYAAPEVTNTLTVGMADQVITFDPLPTKSFGDAAFTLHASASSGLAITYSSSNQSVASISGSTVTIMAVGNTVITASQTGNANYNAAASVQNTLNVIIANQTITFGPLATKTFGDAAFTLQASASSGLPITYYSSNPLLASISGSIVTVLGAGLVTITASQDGNAGYLAASDVQQILNINKLTQNIAFNVLPVKTFGDTPFALNAKASSNLQVNYTSSDLLVATISGNTITITGAGTSVITASQDGDSNYSAANPVSQTFTVSKASETGVKNIESPVYNLDMVISPNPAKGNSVDLKYYLEVPSDVSMSILNNQGKVVRQENLGAGEKGVNTAILNLTSLPVGAYIVCLQTKTGCKMVKFIRL
jgi:hypothetical protein